MSKDNDKNAAAESKPDVGSELERLEREIRAAVDREDQRAASSLSAERVRLLHSLPSQPPDIKALKALSGWMDRRKALAPVWSALKEAVAAGIGPGDNTDWLAVECIMALLEYLEGSVALSLPLIDKKKVKGAHDRLVSVDARRALGLAIQIKWAIDDGEKGGGYLAAAIPLATTYGKPAAELALMLMFHYIAPKQGPIPKGRWTTPQIIAWLMGGGEATRKLASSAQRKALRARAAP